MRCEDSGSSVVVSADTDDLAEDTDATARHGTSNVGSVAAYSRR
jgi:hypothetical protein